MDFLSIISTSTTRNPNDITIRPSFNALSEDILVKGGDLYGYWNGTKWQRSLSALIRDVDKQLYARRNELLKVSNPETKVTVMPMKESYTRELERFKNFISKLDPTEIVFDSTIHFPDQELKREDYATKTLPYSPTEGPTPAFDEMMSVLYFPEELDKILWFMGALLCGDMKKIQKFLYLYGGKGTGKGTVIKIFRKIFEGYCGEIDLMTLTGNGSFPTSQVKELPVLIDEDCDISKITNDTYLLKLTAHETIEVNAKYKTPYNTSFDGLLITASNERFKVKHVDAGITRRAVVAEPTNNKIPTKKYQQLMDQIEFEIAGIAYKAMKLYKSKGIGYYENYVDLATIEETDYIYAFVEEYRDRLGDPCTLAAASALYLEYLNDLGFDTNGYKKAIKIKLKKYYKEFASQAKINGLVLKNVYSGFKSELFKSSIGETVNEVMDGWIALKDHTESLKSVYSDRQAQYTTKDGFPIKKWEEVTTTLKDIDETKLHYVRVPDNHIVIDFDLKGKDGEKSLELNLKAATKFPKTYCEVSKSGAGIHLHYIYNGDVTALSSLYSNDIEIKVFRGLSSLRRKLSKCNDEEITTISSGLPLKERNNKMYKDIEKIIWNEDKIRSAIKRNLRKEVHSATKPSIDLIDKILADAVAADVIFDVSDMEQAVILFASSSTNQAKKCLETVSKMKFKNEPERLIPAFHGGAVVIPNQQLWIYDVEVYRNVFIVVAKSLGTGEYIELINPDKYEIEDLLQKPLVGFNNLKYDNHILYGAMLGESNEELYIRSQGIINKDRSAFAYNAYGLSYLDIYEMSTVKQSLKKFEAELDIKHDEMDWPWDKPLPEELWGRALEYCRNDVDATESVFYNRAMDYKARCILASISGLPINAKTQEQTAKIIFGDDKNPQSKFIYTDLSETFPGYTFEYKTREVKGKDKTIRIVKEPVSMYMGEEVGEGGYVYSEPGVYNDVVLLDIGSQHPHSLIAMNYFGPYTKNYADLVDARMYIKHGEFDKVRPMFDGKLTPYLNDEDSASELAYSLKIPINIVYGMTSASFDNPFRHPKNFDNIVAKRGALFMVNLKHEVQKRGFTVAHIKTDSIKIPNATPEIIDFVMEYGKKYSYNFEHEATYSRMALVDKAQYIAQYGWAEKKSKIGKWEATGAKFQPAYIYKKLFTKEHLEDNDFFQTFSATAPIYLADPDQETESIFVGKVATVYPSKTGYELHRVDGDKKSFVNGSKGYLWRLKSEFRGLKDIDMSYFDTITKKAIGDINKLELKAKGVDTTMTSDRFMLDDVPVEYESELIPF